MKRRVPSPLRLATLAAIAAAGLVAAPNALGASAPGNLASNPVSPGNQTSWAFTWDPGTPELAGPVTYEGGLVDGILDEPTTPVASGVSINPAEGGRYFRVRSVEPGALPSAYTTLPILVDRTGPSGATITLSGPSGGVGGWFRAPLTVQVSNCLDAGVGVAAAACVDRPWSGSENFFLAGTATTPLSDILGNPSALPIPQAFGFDNTRPLVSQTGGTAPVAPGALVASEPTFEWTPGVDVMSGIDRYQLVFSTDVNFGDEYTDTGGQVIANRNHVGGDGNFKAARDPDLRPAPLPEKVALKWWVRSIDKAGNLRRSSAFDLKIDPTVPPAPSITGGPSAPTRDKAPTFAWQGSENNFHWELTSAGSQQPIRQGGGAATQTTLAALPDSDYVFRLTQITEAGQSSAEATRAFKVDTTPPGAPTIVARPTFPSIGAAPLFVWTTEPGAFSRWTVLGPTGVVVGPIDTPITSAELPQLAEGPYTFQVVQIDPAGNVSAATTEAFTVLAPLVAPTPAQAARTAFLSALPKQNALRLRPKAGKTLPTLRPVLRWKRGPRGTKLYNLQVFRVTPGKTAKARPKVRKVLSRFPRGRQYRAPAKRLRAGTCYVWRVWPYTGTAFTRRPVGVSNFCVASKKVLRARAIRTAKIRAAKIRAAKIRAARARAARLRR